MKIRDIKITGLAGGTVEGGWADELKQQQARLRQQDTEHYHPGQEVGQVRNGLDHPAELDEASFAERQGQDNRRGNTE